MKRNLLFCLSLWMLCAFTTTAVAEEVDYTSSIVNADLSTTDAWNTEGTKGISGGVVKVGSGSSFDFSQTITIPAGHYKMTAKAAYRYGANEQEEYDAIQAGANTHLAKLYAQTAAQTFETNVFNRYEGASETDYAAGSGSVTVNGLFVPNSSAAVQTWFEAGQYVNVLEFDVLEDGDVKIGIVKTESAANGDYANIGAWTLTRTGDVTYFADGDYLIVNTETGCFLGGGNDWGTHATLLRKPQFFTLAHQGGNAYTLDSHQSNGGASHFLSTGLYCDGAAANWTFAKTESGNYTINNGGNYLAGNGANKVIVTVTEPNAAAEWTIISRDEAIAALDAATQENPVDATFYIANPEFKRNAGGWTITSAAGTGSPSNFAMGSSGNNANCAESYHSTNGFDASQTLAGMKPGVYRLDAHAFYRNDGDNTGVFPYVYVNEQQSLFPARTGPENDMASAYASFLNGSYAVDPIYFTVEEGGEVKIGVNGANTAFWNIWGEFGLTYYGVDADIATLKFGAYVAQVEALRATATEYLSADISPIVKAAIEVALAASENIELTEEAYVEAINVLTAANNNAKSSASNKVAIDNMYDLMEKTNVYTPAAYFTFKAAADDYKAKWEAGTLTETVVNPYAVQGWHAENVYDDFLLSAWGTNNFDTNLYINTWSVEGEGDGSNFKVPFFEYWTGDDQSLGETTKTATVAGLMPNGNYSVSAWVRVRMKNGATAPTYGITLSVGADGAPVDVAAGTQVGDSPFFIGEYKAVGVADAEGNLTINFNIAADNNISWLSFKNVKYNFAIAGASNLDFSVGTPVDNGICTYGKDMATNGTTYYGLLDVEGWTKYGVGDNANEEWPNSAMSGGIFAYGSEIWIGGTGYNVPATNPEGVAEGNALGVVAVWDAVAQYTQPVTLAAGTYSITVPVYNAVGGTTAPQKSLIGFIADNGTEYLAPAKAYPVNTWTNEVITFTLAEETTGVLSLGYDAPGAGSGANQHLFFDCVKIETVSPEFAAANVLAEAINAANATVLAKANVGEALFQKPVAALDAYAAAVATAKGVLTTAGATIADYNAAVEVLAAATATYNEAINAPAAQEFTIKHNVSGLFMTLDGGVKLTETATVKFEDAGNGKYYIADADGEYAGYAGNNTWSMSSTADTKEAWTITAVGEGLYTIKGKNGFIGTDGTEVGATCYGNKAGDAANSMWVIEAVPMEVTLINPAGETAEKMVEGDFIKFTTNIEDAYILVGVLQVSDEDPTNTEYLTSYRAAVKGESDWSVELFSTMKFREGYTYKFEFTAYESEDAYNALPWDAEPGEGAIGSDTVVVKGALPAYVYATATLNDIKPAYGSVIESETDNVVTLTFSEPVKVVYAQNLQSAGMMMPPTVNELTPVAVEADENGLAAVWTVEMPLTPGFANISFAAEDAEGRRIWGNMGEEEESYFSYEWQCTVGIPEVKVAPAGYVAGPVSTLTVTCAEQIDPYMGGGVVLNAAGEEVATIANMEKLVDENLEMWTPEWYEAMATAPVTITLSNEITEPGTYTVKLDAGLFMLNSGAYNSKATEATFAIIPAENLVEMNVERIVNLGYAADVVDVDLAAICEKLGVASISEATVWGVNATTLEYVADAMTEYDGWRNAEGDFTEWGNNHQVCYKYIADGAFQLCTEGGNEPAVGTEYTAYWAFSTASDTVVLKTNITFVAAPKVEMEIVKTITVNHYEKPNTSYSGNTATFDVNEVTEALGITSITEAEQYIMNVTDGSLVKNNTDGWRGANGDALGWGNPGGVCVKINDPASGIIDYIGCYDNAWNEGDSFVAKWAFVYEGKAVVIEVVIDFNTEMATGINGISAGDVVKTQYIGINGAVLNAPAKGVNIVKQTLKNGKVVTSKVYVK